MVLSHSLRRLGDAPVHVVAVGRAEPWALVLDDATSLTLPPLGTAALFHVVKEHLGLALDRSRLRALEQSSGGNPLYALELARRQVGGSASATLDELIGARVRALPADTRRSLLRAACELPALLLVGTMGLAGFLLYAAAAGDSFAGLAAASVTLIGVVCSLTAFAGGLFGAWFRRAKGAA